MAAHGFAQPTERPASCRAVAAGQNRFGLPPLRIRGTVRSAQRVPRRSRLAGSSQTRLSRLPASGPRPGIALGFDGWVLPKAGIAFVWVLEREMALMPQHDMHLTAHAHD
jgi:hypothetical protein